METIYLTSPEGVEIQYDLIEEFNTGINGGFAQNRYELIKQIVERNDRGDVA